MNNYFVSITDSLYLRRKSDVTISAEGVSDPIERAIIRHSKHPKIAKSRSSVQKYDKFFKFQVVYLEQMVTEIEMLNLAKATTFRNIPVTSFSIIV